MTAANAELLKITGPAGVDRYGDNTGTGTTLWTGRAPGYLKRQRRTVVSGGIEVKVERDIFTLLHAAGVPASMVAGPDHEATTVQIEDRRTPTPATRTFTVVAMENRAGGSVADSVRLELDEETA